MVMTDSDSLRPSLYKQANGLIDWGQIVAILVSPSDLLG